MTSIFAKTKKARARQEEQKRADAQARIDAFIEAEAKLEEEHGVELVATMNYTQHGAFPIVQVRVRITPPPSDAPKEAENSPQQEDR